jgi:hypothetical protein
MTWFTVLKMPNPFGGTWQTLTSSEYHKMDDNNKRNYHNAMASFYKKQIKQAVTPRKAGQAPPATDDQIRGLRELARFHGRQEQRIMRKLDKENYYSLDEEQNRRMMKPQFDAVERMPHTTKEMYDNFTRKQKINYWMRLSRRLRQEYGQTEAVKLARRMAARMRNNPNYTAPFEGDKSRGVEYKDKYKHRDVSEYDNFTDEEKRKYHGRMRDRAKVTNKNDERNFHGRMLQRIMDNTSLPTYPTPEAEKGAEEE